MTEKEKLMYLIEEAADIELSAEEAIADHLIANGVTVQRWIPVTEWMPEDDLPEDNTRKTVKCLVAIKAQNGVTVRTQLRFKDHIYKDGKRKECWRWKFAHGDVTHWMPLPEPPKEET